MAPSSSINPPASEFPETVNSCEQSYISVSQPGFVPKAA